MKVRNNYRSDYGITKQGKRHGDRASETGCGAQGCSKSGIGKRWPDFPPRVKKTSK